MMQPPSKATPKILFVDDETQALKYFTKAFAKDFVILTAESVDQASAILEEESDKIGVLITDQRMPGKTGVDLLAHTRDRYPDIIRILTTAYSEIDKAISAVNDGEIFRYITKPWDLSLLKQELVTATQFYQLRKERNLLVQEKLGYTYKSIIIDRIKSLILFSQTIHNVNAVPQACKSFLEDFSAIYDPEKIINEDRAIDLWSVPTHEIYRMKQVLEDVINTTRHFQNHFDEKCDICDLLVKTKDHLVENMALNPTQVQISDLPDLSFFKNEAGAYHKLIEILMKESLKAAQEESSVLIEVDNGSYDEINIIFRGQFEPMPNVLLFQNSSDILTDPQSDLLLAYIIAHHHGGELKCNPLNENDALFHLCLRCVPSSERQYLNMDLWSEETINKIFTLYEA